MRKRKNGFTLIELLAVIVILAVIALIATASIISIINRAEKGALEDSAYGIIEAGNVFYIDYVLPGGSEESYEKINFEIIGGKFVNVKNKEEALAFKGSMPKTGKLQINANGDTAIAICSNKYCACKSITESKVIVQKQGCEIDEETGEIGTKKDATPTGTVISFMGNNAPDGYLICDGTTYNISEYPKLAELLKTEFGSYNYFGGDGTSTFAVPDLRGEFLRGTGINSHTNQGSGADVGKHQDATIHDRVGVHQNGSSDFWVGGYGPAGDTHALRNADSLFGKSTGFYFGKYSSNTSSQYVNQPTQGTSRPTNTAVLYCIKY